MAWSQPCGYILAYPRALRNWVLFLGLNCRGFSEVCNISNTCSMAFKSGEHASQLSTWKPFITVPLLHIYRHFDSYECNITFQYQYFDIAIFSVSLYFFFTWYLSLHFWSWPLWIPSSYIKATISWHNSFANKRLKVAYLIRQHGVNLLRLNVNVLWYR